MQLRRMLMTIGGDLTVGNLSKYEQKTLTFSNASNASNWDNGAIVPCSFEPKIVYFTSDDASNEHIQKGIFLLDNTAPYGVVFGLTTSGSEVGSYYKQHSTASIGRFKYDNGKLYICRAAATVYWHSEDTYTFEIYG